MSDSETIESLARELAAQGAVPPGSDVVALLSGGADSACLAAALVELCGPQRIVGLHVNYALREGSDDGERAARALCARLRIDLHVERPRLEGGNLQARARRARYEAAERLRSKLGFDWVAAGHTRTDLAETVLYRLAVSPGSRALLGMPARSEHLLRPLLSVSRGRARAIARACELPFADDPTNLEPTFARNRIRLEVMPALAEIGPEVERNLAETQAELREDAELIGELAREAIVAAGCEAGAPLRHEELATMSPALRRAVLAELAERAAGEPVRISRARAGELLRLAGAPEGGLLELGRGVRAVAEAGVLWFVRGEPPVPAEPARIGVPGRAQFGEWRLEAVVVEPPIEPAGPELATLDADLLGDELEVRAWREGDRMRPLGLEGTKSLQDLFVDAGVPRSVRRRLPVLVAGGRIAWVAGVAVSDEFRLGPGSRRAAVLTAHAADAASAAPPEVAPDRIERPARR